MFWKDVYMSINKQICTCKSYQNKKVKMINHGKLHPKEKIFIPSRKIDSNCIGLGQSQ